MKELLEISDWEGDPIMGMTHSFTYLDENVICKYQSFIPDEDNGWQLDVRLPILNNISEIDVQRLISFSLQYVNNIPLLFKDMGEGTRINIDGKIIYVAEPWLLGQLTNLPSGYSIFINPNAMSFSPNPDGARDPFEVFSRVIEITDVVPGTPIDKEDIWKNRSILDLGTKQIIVN